jgi:hypothetical protein
MSGLKNIAGFLGNRLFWGTLLGPLMTDLINVGEWDPQEKERPALHYYSLTDFGFPQRLFARLYSSC